MPARCVHGMCDHTPDPKAGVSLHWFPRDRTSRRFQLWVSFVKQRRADFKPSKTASLCSKHFTDASFTNRNQFNQGLAKRLVLSDDAIPSINPHYPLPGETRPGAPPSKMRRKDQDEVAGPSRSQEPLVQPCDVDVWEYDSDNVDELSSASSFSEVEADVADDPDYQRSTNSSDTTDENRFSDNYERISEEMNFGSIILEKKFIVGAQSLYDILRVCRSCTGKGNDVIVKSHSRGAVLVADLQCTLCKVSWRWQSLGEAHSDIAIHNSQLTGAMLFNGLIPSPFIRYMDTLNIAFPSRDTFFVNQREVHLRVVNQQWDISRGDAVNGAKARGGPLDLGGDGRCDSMGFCAQFGSYTLMDLKSNQIVDMEPVSRVETKLNSYAMELEGLKRALAKLKAMDVEVRSLVTDRHSGITSYMKEKNPDTMHYFDTWHLVRTISKKLNELAKKKAHREELTPARIRSITNRLYAIADETRPGPDFLQTMDEKRGAILRHLTGVHRHPGNRFYKKCGHKKVNNKRMKKDGETYKAVQNLLEDKQLRKGICRLSPVGQTSRLESYHSTILSFAPKNQSFGYNGMVARLQLAAIHYNENANRESLLDEEGGEKLRVTYPKFKYGKGKARVVKANPTYAYVQELLRMNLKAMSDPSFKDALPTLPKDPGTMTAAMTTQSREEVKATFRSRFTSPQ